MDDTKRESPLVPLQKPLSWDGLKALLPDMKAWIFRGQQRASWRLSSTLERVVVPEERARVEEDLRYRYQQAIDNFLPSGQIPSGSIDWLASMQHHGAPTRLLDFTRSPYVAMYFAVENAEGDEDCALWAIDQGWCLTAAGRAIAPESSEDEPRIRAAVDWIYDINWPSKKLVAPAGARRMSQRQIAQQAIFAVPGDLSVSFEENLAAMAATPEELASHVKCFPISTRLRGRALEDLRLMNISRATLFPGLDGFAQSLRYSLVAEDPTQRMIRQVLRDGFDGPYEVKE